jgi:hypothetical protein
MRLTIELTPTEGARLSTAARMKGADDAELARKFVTDRLPQFEADTSSPAEPRQAPDVENDHTIALLKSWLAEDATDDPEELCQAQRELEEFKRNMNAPRKEAGTRVLFPEVE